MFPTQIQGKCNSHNRNTCSCTGIQCVSTVHFQRNQTSRYQVNCFCKPSSTLLDYKNELQTTHCQFLDTVLQIRLASYWLQHSNTVVVLQSFLLQLVTSAGLVLRHKKVPRRLQFLFARLKNGEKLQGYPNKLAHCSLLRITLDDNGFSHMFSFDILFTYEKLVMLLFTLTNQKMLKIKRRKEI